jgi:hypothetical protein
MSDVDAQVAANSLLISLLAGSFDAETGSQLTASTASHPYELLSSCARLDFHPTFPIVVRRPA